MSDLPSAPLSMSEVVVSASQEVEPPNEVDAATELNSLITVDGGPVDCNGDCKCACHSTPQPPSASPPSRLSHLLTYALALSAVFALMTASWWVGAHPTSLALLPLPSLATVWQALTSPAPPPPPPMWDPLAACTAISPNLTASIRHYIDTVQRPHVSADCRDYPETGQCITSPTPSDNTTHPFQPHWLAFRVDAGNRWSGGFADRFKGLYTAFGLALVLKRAMIIDFRDSVMVDEYLARGEVPWVGWEEVPKVVVTGDGKWGSRNREFSFIMAGQFINRTERGAKRDWVREWGNLSIVGVQYNMNGWASLRENFLMTPPYNAVFGLEPTRLDMDTYWGCLQAALFRYSGAVEKVMNPLLTEMGRPKVNEIVVGTKARGLQVHSLDSNRTVQIVPLSPPRRLYCAQIRMGSAAKTGDVAGQDTESFITMEKMEGIFTHMADTFTRDRQQHNVSADGVSDLFITSDSEDYQQLVPKYFPATMYRAVTVPGVQGHLDILARDGSLTIEQKLSAHVKVVGSHYLLGECDMVYISQSGYGATAVWRTRNRGMEDPMREVGYEGRVWQVVTGSGEVRPYAHRVGSSGREAPNEGGDPSPAEI